MTKTEVTTETEQQVVRMLERGDSLQYIVDLKGISREKIKNIQLKYGIETKDKKRGWRFGLIH